MLNDGADEKIADLPKARTSQNWWKKIWHSGLGKWRIALVRPGFWIVAAACLGVAVFLALRARGPLVHTVIVLRQDLEQHIIASGRVWVPTRVRVAAQTSGLVVAVAVSEGQRVKAGDLLVQMDAAGASAAVAEAQAAVSQANARSDQLQRVGAIVATSELRQAQTNLDHAKKELSRVEMLAATGAVPQVDLDNARPPVALSQAQKTAAEARQLSSAPKGADSRIALTGLLQAEAQLTAAKLRFTQTTIVASENALVLARSVEPGDVVQAAQTLLVLAAGEDSAQLVFQSDERNLAAIQLGQKARVSADAYPQEVFDAQVSYIAPSIDPQRGSIEVRLRTMHAPVLLKPDMTVSIDLTVAAKKQVLTLPSDAVHGAATPQPWLFAVERGHLVRKNVTLGIRGDGTVEIAANLPEGASVVLPDAQRLRAGQRVRTLREAR